VVIAADLQDPPELLKDMIARWRDGVKVVLATRDSRADPLLSRLFSHLYYRLFRVLVSRDMPIGGFDFFLMDAQVNAQLLRCVEKNSSIPATLLWLGFRREIIHYHRAARQHGRSRWTFGKKFKYMYDSILSFSYYPLRLITGSGVLGLLVSLLYGVDVTVHRLKHPEDPPGWASLMIVTLFFSGLTMMAIGIVGEYVWRTFDAARRRPLFIVADCTEPAAHLQLEEADGHRQP
jgi:dolichol-phosphate mannosyltransferase